MRGGPPAWGSGEELTTPRLKNVSCYETFHKASDMDWSFGNTQAVEKGHGIRQLG